VLKERRKGKKFTLDLVRTPKKCKPAKTVHSSGLSCSQLAAQKYEKNIQGNLNVNLTMRNLEKCLEKANTGEIEEKHCGQKRKRKTEK
jgi:hypothetical protein